MRAQAIWAVGSIAQGFVDTVSSSYFSSSRPSQALPTSELCAAALALLRAHPTQEKTASSAIRALGFLAGEVEVEEGEDAEGVEGLQAACLATLLAAIEDQEGEREREREREKDEVPTARIKTRWNACCALASVLRRLEARAQREREEGRRRRPRPWAARVVRTLVHTLMADENAKVGWVRPWCPNDRVIGRKRKVWVRLALSTDSTV